MKQASRLILSTSPPVQDGGKPPGLPALKCRRRLSCGGMRRMPVLKERDAETGLYYYGARYLDPKTSRWLSGDPAMGEYIPSAPINDEAKKRNQNLPGMGGVFNVVNLHAYHYAGNNPVKYIDPDGRDFFNFTNQTIIIIPENSDDNAVIVRPGEVYYGAIDGVVLKNNTMIVKVTSSDYPISLYMENIDGEDRAFIIGKDSITTNTAGDIYKFIKGIFQKNRELPSGVYNEEAIKKHSEFDGWIRKAREAETCSPRVRKMTENDIAHANRLKENKQQIPERE
jgi:RHS repeat-associated protein